LLESRVVSPLGLLPQRCMLTTHTFPGVLESEGKASVTRASTLAAPITRYNWLH
jgi:hypothetical protein